jgi:high-affinity iron transporter
LKTGIENETTQALRTGGKALFFLAFLAVFREGLELAIFLLATSFVSGGNLTLVGAFLGLSLAVVIGWVIFSTTNRLSLSGFFKVTNILLIFFAAGMVAYGVHELNEAGWIPSIIYPVWDINHILSDKSELGLVLKALFGYNGNPSLTEVIAYVTFLTLLLANYVRFQRNNTTLVPKKAISEHA